MIRNALDARCDLPMFAHAGPRGGMVDTGDLKSLGRMAVPVRVRPWVPANILINRIKLFGLYPISIVLVINNADINLIDP